MSSFKNRSPPSVFPGVFGLLTSKKFINFKCVLPESITVVYFTCQCRQCFETLRVHAICFHLWFVFLNFLVRVNFKAFINLIIREIAGPSSLGFLFVCLFHSCVYAYSVAFFVPYKTKKKIFLETLYERIRWLRHLYTFWQGQTLEDSSFTQGQTREDSSFTQGQTLEDSSFTQGQTLEDSSFTQGGYYPP